MIGIATLVPEGKLWKGDVCCALLYLVLTLEGAACALQFCVGDSYRGRYTSRLRKGKGGWLIGGIIGVGDRLRNWTWAAQIYADYGVKAMVRSYICACEESPTTAKRLSGTYRET
ncbi:hypothetical protein F5X98DRAFT_373933 [Xylaria grammica]|nr:hypothetical protein F5X98DRAFT_373933 [Xylaria grammica]